MSVLSELTVMQNIAQKKDLALLSRLDDNWIQNAGYRLVLGLWQTNKNLLEYLAIQSYDITNGLNLHDTIAQIYHTDIKHDVEEAIKELQRGYGARVITKGISDIQSVLKESTPEDAIQKMMDVIQNMPKISRKRRKLTDDYEDINPHLIKIHTPKRPQLEFLYPERQNITVIAGTKGHQKTNTALDFLDNALMANISDPTFKVAFYSKELSFNGVRERMFAKKLKIPLRDIKNRKYSAEKTIGDFCDKFPDYLDRFIIYAPEDFNSIKDMSYLMMQDMPDVWSLDFIQWAALAFAGKASEQNANTIELIASCKMFSQIFNNYGVVLAQLKKLDPTRKLKRSTMDDVEWAGLITQLAQSVGIIYWYYKYNNELQGNDRRIFFISYDKVRDGETFVEILRTYPELCDFEHVPSDKKNKTYQDYLDT